MIYLAVVAAAAAAAGGPQAPVQEGKEAAEGVDDTSFVRTYIGRTGVQYVYRT